MCIYVCVCLCACLYYICIIRRVGTTFGIGGKGTEGALALTTTNKLNWGKKQKDPSIPYITHYGPYNTHTHTHARTHVYTNKIKRD